MSTRVYDQHDKHFAKTAAFAIIRDGDPVARISVKYPRDGAGRLYAYAHWLGREMVRGSAAGCGYDKTGAALHDAARAPAAALTPDSPAVEAAFWITLADDSGWHFQRRLEDAGFRVLQVL
jgi:hypothetical protein